VNSPIGAICGRAKINSASGITLIEAVNLADEIGLSEKEIYSYVGNGNSIGCYRIGSFELAMNPKKTGEINKLVNYNPPQSFLILSKPAKQIIDEMSEFCSIPAEGAES
jgi:predicted transcriptional regulator